jgi:AcrR family transcriptional regulator
MVSEDVSRTGMFFRMTASTGAWGANTPLDEEQARERLLIAAEACYADRGPTRTRMSDIATRAGVHRSTVYYYFTNKDAVLAAAFVRAVTGVLLAAEPCWHTAEPFLEQLVCACIAGNAAARKSPTMRLLIDDDQAIHTFHAAEASDVWRATVAEALGERLVSAVAAGEVRADLTLETLARWITRINFSLISEPGNPDDGGDEGILRALLVPSLTPTAGGYLAD